MKRLILLALVCLSSFAQTGVQLMPLPKQQFLDASGVPLAGGLVYTYRAGTTTPLVTYTDSTGNTANVNPIVLDSGGFANIWLSTAAYKIVVQSAAGVTQYTTDNVSTQGVNLTPTTLDTIRMADQYTGGDCGAKINAADSSLGATPGEIWVTQACGTSWTTGVALSANRVLRFSQGGNYTSTANPMITVAGDSAIDGGAMGGIYAIGGSNVGGTTLASATNVAVTISIASNADHVGIRNLAFKPTAFTPGYCIAFTGSGAADVLIQNVYGQYCVDGILISGGATINVHVNDVTFASVTAGIEVSAGSSIFISHVQVTTSTYGVLVDPSSGSVTGINIDNCRLDSNAYGVDMVPSSTGSVLRTTIIGGQTAGNNINGILMSAAGGSSVDGVRVLGVRILGNGQHGVSVSGSTNIAIDNCDIGGNSTTAGGTYDGISFGASVSHFSASNNRITPQGGFTTAQKWGIETNTFTGDYYVLTNNDTNATTVHDADTNTHKTITGNL